MNIRFIFYVIPVPVIFTGRLIGKGFAGRSYGVFIVVRPDYRNDEPLIQHELEHCRQWYRTLGVHGILMKVCSNWRFKREVEAYAVQALWHTEDERNGCIGRFSVFISEKYNLDVSYRAARKWLKREINERTDNA